MITKTEKFILEVHNIPSKARGEIDFSIQNDKIANWSLETIKEVKSKRIAYIACFTKTPITEELLTEDLEFTVYNGIMHTEDNKVICSNIQINRTDYYETLLADLIESYNEIKNDNQDEIKLLADLLGYQMESLDSLILLNHECPLYTDQMASTYWKYIECLEDDEDDDLIHDVNSDICVMENTKLPTEKLYLAYHNKGSEEVQSYIAARDNISTYYPAQAS